MYVNFEMISGQQKYDSIQLKTENGNYRTAIETAKAVCMGSRIVLFKKEDNKLILFNPSDIINEPMDLVVVDISDRTLNSCAKDGLIDMAKWLYAYGCKLNKYIISDAVENGHVIFAKWALENGCPFYKNLVSAAAHDGNIEFAKWIRDHGYPWGKYVIESAAINGHIEFAKWALENGCPRDDGYDMIISAAAKGGYIEFAKWALANGYQWGKNAIAYAEEINCIEFAEWARENGCPS